MKMWSHRLRTRMAYVQGAEKSLEERREHCKLFVSRISTVVPLICAATDVKVVKAFESALALLGGP